MSLKKVLSALFYSEGPLYFCPLIEHQFMNSYHISHHKSFYVVGLSYKKADANIRGIFSIPTESKLALLQQAPDAGVRELMVISTCNRTEIYGFAEHPFQLIQLLCEFSKGSVDAFGEVGYVYKNHEAVSHMFRVGTGLDSQILGDFEIIGQIKQSFLLSKEWGLTDAFMERLVNAVIQASKRVKNETEISSGATSVAFAAVQYILGNIPEIATRRILLFGVGKIGRNTCENLVKHTSNKHITLINRTQDKAERIAGKFDVTVKPLSKLADELQQTDVLVVATGAKTPTITKEMLPSDRQLLILDLSIPKNVEERVTELPQVKLVHMDHLSQLTDQTLDRRKQFVPQAQSIIKELEDEFNKWVDTRRYAPTIKALKEKLSTIKSAEIDFQRKKISDFNEEQAEIIADRIIQKITTHFVNHFKGNETSPESLEWVRKVFQLGEIR